MAEVKFSEFPEATGADLASVFVVGLDELNANAKFPGTDLKGDKGDQGPPGAQGTQGIQGPQGDTGPQGIEGQQGSQGVQGDTGPQGIQGDTGATGAQGPQGIQGEVGPQGDAGSGYFLQGDATVAELNAMTASAIPTNNAWSMLDAGTVQPIGSAVPTPVVAGDLVVWGEADYFVN